jgi:DNA-binding response OmpR family regulator
MTTVLVAVAADGARAFLTDQLSADDHDAVPAASHGQALLGAQTECIDALIVDLALPNHDGTRLLRELRAGEHAAPGADLPALAVLGDGAGELDLLRAYEAGADDVARHDATYPELRWRLCSLLRRSRPSASSARRRRVGALEVDLAARTAAVDGVLVQLSRLEFDLLAVLSSDPGRVFTKRELLSEIWGIPDGVSTRTLDSHACRLRQRLAQAGGQFVSNRWGIGYALLTPG